MGYALIWTESLAVALVLVALIAACAARWPPLWRWGVSILVSLLLLAPAVGLTWGLRVLSWQGVVPDGKFYEALGWTVVLALGMAGIYFIGFRPSKEATGLAALAWPRGRLAVALGLVVILDVITVSNMDLAVKMQLNAVRAEAGAKILALTPPRLPDHDNAAPVYQEAFEALTPREQLPTPWKEKASAWFEPTASFDFQDKDLGEFLRSQERGLALLRKAAALPGCSFERDYFLSIEMPIPELNRMRDVAQLLALDARSKSRRGDGAGAIDDVAAIFGVARHTNEPMLITMLLSGTIDRLGVAALEDVLAQAAPKPEDLARLSPRDVSYNKALQRALQMEEVALGLPLYAAVNTGPGDNFQWLAHDMNPLGRWVLDSPLYRIFFLADDLAAYRRNMKEFQDLAGRPYAEARLDWDRQEQWIKANRAGGILTGLLIPAVQRVAVAAARTDATHRLAQLALAAEAYRAKNGKYPERLQDLTPDFLPPVPADPFTGQPPRLKHDGKDLVLYSVGPDDKDDGGTPWNDSQGKGDIVFRLRGR